MPTPDRIAMIGDAAIEVLAERGMRGLTHRAVDAAAGLPPGSTSYYARTRAALLELVMARMVEQDLADSGPAAGSPPLDPTDLDAVAEQIAAMLHAALTRGQTRMVARYEFALEGIRRPELRAVYDRAGTLLRGPAPGLLAAAGSPDPQRHARFLITWCEGVLFDSLAGAGRRSPPSLHDLRAGARELLRGMLGR